MSHATIPVATADALALLHRLQQHPLLYERLETLLSIVENTDGNAFTADEAEEPVAQELRRIGHDTLQEWAGQRQDHIETRHAARGKYQRKEKNFMVADALRGHQRSGASVARGTPGA